MPLTKPRARENCVSNRQIKGWFLLALSYLPAHKVLAQIRPARRAWLLRGLVQSHAGGEQHPLLLPVGRSRLPEHLQPQVLLLGWWIILQKFRYRFPDVLILLLGLSFWVDGLTCSAAPDQVMIRDIIHVQH